MTRDFTWEISALDCAVSENGLENVVKTIHWRYRLTDENNVSVDFYDAQFVPLPNPDSFVPYENLTQEIVVEWLEQVKDVPALQAMLISQLEQYYHPAIVTLPLPPLSEM